MTREPADNRLRILAIGEGIIAGKGFSAVGLKEILTAAQVPKGSFYHYFESKEQFGEAMLEQYFADYLVRLDALLGDPALSIPERLLAYWQQWLEVQCQDPESRGCDGAEVRQCLVVKLSAEVSDLSEAMRKVLRKGSDQVLARLANAIAQGVADGSLPPGLEPESTALALYQLWLGASLLAKVRRELSPLSTAMSTTRTWLGQAQA